MRVPEHGFCRYMGVLGLSVRRSLASVFLDLPLDCPLINRKGKGLMIKERVPEGGGGALMPVSRSRWSIHR